MTTASFDHARSTNRRNQKTKSRIDRFSNLPTEIAHDILSRLNFKDLTRVGCLSKRCREFYISTPYLNFHDLSGVDTSTRLKNERVLDSLSRFFVQRGVHHKIQCFRFRWDLWVDLDDGDDDDDDCDVYFQSRLREWIEIAVRCNVEVIHLVVIPNNTFGDLPASLLHCKSLKSLTVDMICNISVVPSMDFSSNLECLRLKDVSIKNDGDRFLKWISGCCTSIKELLLEDCAGVNNLVIESSSLESFCYQSHEYNDGCHVNISGDRLEKLHFVEPIGRKTNRLVNISAPNLKYLEWIGEFSNRQNLGNLMFLEKAVICSSPWNCNFDVLFDFLCSIRKVKLLFLDPDTLELSFISHAKKVVIHYKFRSNVIEFAYYILEHARDLEKMIIYYPHGSEVLNAVMKLRTTAMSKGIHFHKIVTHYDFQVIRSLVRFNLW
ncbi:F-box protein [Pyrus ussuriensis x Pyrus communis]|uniref:F-box protein n=1 Tax=Pyrus ussuriensis x Pyrus communis TaxID=2448454 RepID=A0A5N5HD32_9ROSA|nr:F-box protein [Pyrus ussuriensis x Pyrus communis]